MDAITRDKFRSLGGPLRYQIERLTFGGILDQSFRLMRDHFVTLTAGFAAFYIPFNVISGFVPTPDQAAGAAGAPAELLLKLAVYAAFLVLYLAVCLPFAQLLVTMVVTDIYLGHPIDLRDALRRSGTMYLRYLGTTMLSGLLVVGGLFLCFVPGIYLMVGCAVVGPIAVVEGVYGSSAISRSRALVKDHFGRTFGVVVVMTLLVTALSAAAQAVFGFIPFLGLALTGVVNAVTAAYSSTVLAVLYVDLRCRHEDFDVQLLASQVAANSGNVSGGLNAPAA